MLDLMDWSSAMPVALAFHSLKTVSSVNRSCQQNHIKVTAAVQSGSK